MDKNIKTILESIEKEGFEAYVVGGYVRDYIRGVASTDVDICTNALPKDLKDIFKNGNSRNDIYGSYKITTNKYNFDITTYREELKYEGRRPTEIAYVDNLITDIKRRDFTINALCMNKEGKIIDLLNGKEDIDNKRIRVIGSVEDKLSEDPLRMLRALRFGITLDFAIEAEIINFIKEHTDLIKTLSLTRKKYELDCILVSQYALKGLDLIKKLDLNEALGIWYNNVIYSNDISAMWAQIETDESMFTKEEKELINSLREIISYGKIDNYVLYKYGLYLCSVAGSVLNIDVVKINEMFNTLPITNIKDIAITTQEILNLFNIKPSKVIKEIFESIKNSILNGDIINEKEEIINYLNANKAVWINGSSSIIVK